MPINTSSKRIRNTRVPTVLHRIPQRILHNRVQQVRFLLYESFREPIHSRCARVFSRAKPAIIFGGVTKTRPTGRATLDEEWGGAISRRVGTVAVKFIPRGVSKSSFCSMGCLKRSRFREDSEIAMDYGLPKYLTP